jgi:hypothetical protein
MLHCSVLFDALSSAFGKKEFPEQTHPIGCAMPGFSRLLCPIKKLF